MRRIGDYELEAELGRGGFGAVYRARALDTNRRVALKVLHGASPAQLTRFRREGEALARLSHPGLVRVHTVGDANGAPFLVMELIEGTPLARRVEQGPLPQPEAAELARQLAEALAHAHDRHVLHRDLKPDNVLVAEGGRAVLVDFGLTKALDASEDAEQLTRTGHTLGTLGYLPPEQARGDKASIGPASDVYGLGAILYAMLTGSPPHAGVTMIELLSAALAPVEPPSGLRPELDRGLERVCLACLALDPAERPAASDVAAQLERWLAGERLAWPAARPLALALALLVAVLLVAALTGALGEGLHGSSPSPAPSAVAARPAPGATTSPVPLAAAGDDRETTPPPSPPGPARPADTSELRCLAAWGDRRGRTGGYVRSLVLVGDRLLSAGRTGLRWWRAADGARLGTLDQDSARAVGASPDGRLLISGGEDGAVRLWDAEGGRVVRRLGEHPGRIEVARFDPSGRLAFVAGHGSADAGFQVWTVRDGELQAQRKVSGGVYAAAFLSPTRALTGNGGGVLELWDLTSGESLQRFQVGKGATFGLSVSPDRQLLFTSTWQDRRVALWSLATPAPSLLEEEVLPSGMMPTRVFDGGRRVAAGDGVHAWGEGWAPAPTAGQVEPVPGRDTVWGLAATPSGDRLWLATNAGILFALDPAGGRLSWERPGHLGRVLALTDHPEGTVSASTDGTVRVWGDDGELRALRHVHDHYLGTAAATPDGVILGGSEHTDSGVAYAPDAGGRTLSLAGSGEGLYLLSLGGPDEGVLLDTVYRLRSFRLTDDGLELGELDADSEQVRAIAAQRDGPLAASGAEDGTIRLWDRKRARLIDTLRGHTGSVSGLAFRPGHSELVSVSADGTLRRWDLASGACVAVLAAQRPREVVIDPRGRYAAAPSGTAVALWDLDSGRALSPVELGPLGDAAAVAAFAAGGDHLLVGTALGVVYRFALRPRG